MTTESQKEASARWYAKNKYKISEKRRGKRKEEHKASYAYILEKYGRAEVNRKSKEWREKNLDKARLSCNNSRKNNPERSILNKARHAAKGRYHTQLAVCALYDALGLPNTKPK